jgi:hypothetical protein
LKEKKMQQLVMAGGLTHNLTLQIEIIMRKLINIYRVYTCDFIKYY